MKNFRAVFAILALLGAFFGWFFFRGDGKAIGPFGFDQQGGLEGVNPVDLPRSKDTILVASFNIQVFGVAKLKKPKVMQALTTIVRQFDVVAIQEVRAKSQDVLPRFVSLLNQNGRKYDYVIGPRLGRTSSKEQYAFIFDTERIEIDRSQLYTIADPDDLLHRESLVGWFRAKNAPPEEAFTFTLVNIHTDPDEVAQEIDVLDNVFFVVRDDGRGEDDVLLLGDFNADHRRVTSLNRISGMAAAVVEQMTNTRKKYQYDNIFLHTAATSEFTGRSGVIDFMHFFNIGLEEALEISDHLPVWAEFSIYEGGVSGRIAAGRSDRR